MAVTISALVQVSDRNYRVEFTSSLGAGTEVKIGVDGVEVGRTTLSYFVVAVEPNTFPVIEVLDDLTAPFEAEWPGYWDLVFEGVAGAEYYRVEELVGAAWTTRQRIPESGRAMYSFRTRFLEDITIHQFRVVPVGNNTVDGNARKFSGLCVRIPDPPTVTLTYDGGTGNATWTDDS